MTARLTRFTCVLILAGSVSLGGCANGGEDVEDVGADTAMTGTMGDAGMQQTATAELQPTEGYNVMGTVTFTEESDGVRVEADIMHLSPGMHGIHVHEFGDCSAPDASSAGGHFNPTGMQHGAPDDSVRHVGDLGNIEAGPDSTASLSRLDTVLSLSGPNSIVGKALVIHSGEDDLTSQPSGNAGDRVACGVIEMAGGGQMNGMDTDTSGMGGMDM